MDLANLQAFVKIAEVGSFSRAAEQLFVSQSAISKRIAALEDQLNATLFDRIGRRVSLTPAGEILKPRAHALLRDAEACRQAISTEQGIVNGRLSLATSHHIGLHRLPPILRAYTERYPKVELDLHFMDSEVACKAVEHAELELAVATLPTTISRNLNLIPIWPDPLSICCAGDHTLAHQATLTPSNLTEFPAVLPGLTTFTRRVFEHALLAFNLKLRLAVETNYLETIKMMVSVGLGWSVLPSSMLGTELVALNIPAIPPMGRQLGIVTHQKRSIGAAAQAFAQMLKQHSP